MTKYNFRENITVKKNTYDRFFIILSRFYANKNLKIPTEKFIFQIWIALV